METTKVNPPTPEAPKQAAPISSSLSSVDQIKKMFEEIEALKQKVNVVPVASQVKAGPVEAPKIDWTKVTDADINNLNIPIPVVEQETPEYLTVHLKDKNYIPRWIHVMRERLGPCLASGYEYVTQDMLDLNYTHPLLFDANGHYSHGDVVCLRILKERYFGALRKNHLKTMTIHGRGVNRAKMQQMIQDDEHLGEAFQKQAIEMYTPEDMKGTEYTKDMFNAI